MVDGRTKGNKYENAICLALSRWLLPSLPRPARIEQLPFRRRTTSVVPLEGHWAGAGDILHRPDLPHPWPFCVECKHVEGWTLDGAFSPGWPVRTWWDQAVRQGERVGLAPLLICGRNHKPDLAFLRSEDASCLGLTQSRVELHRVADGSPVTVVLLDQLTAVRPALLSRVSTPNRSRKRS
jgi:hypothetical protein